MLVKMGIITLSPSEVSDVRNNIVPTRIADYWPEVTLEELKQIAASQADQGEPN